MKSVLFVCHGNICRSPMAEFILKKICDDNNYMMKISSKATSTEELGNTIYYEAKNTLRRHNIPFEDRSATVITKKDYDEYDYIIAMDHYNVTNIKRIIGENIIKQNNKIYLLKSFTGNESDIYDPWYTRDFETCYHEIYENCQYLFNCITER